MITLQNKRMRVEIAELGAELMSIYDRSAESELLWWGDGKYWKRRSPILFPNVGKTYGNVMRIDGTSYPTSQHGFARDMIFLCEEADDAYAVFLLKSTEETLRRYPFPFELRISYLLDGRELRVCWQVRNLSDRVMPFTIGGHPAFCFADAGEGKADYLLRFPGKDALCHILLDPASGTALPDASYALRLTEECLPLTDAHFERDAMIFDGTQIEEVWLCRRDGTPRVGMRCAGFPNFGIWSVPGAPFVCLEPWMGRCDDSHFAGEFSEKENINCVQPGAEFHARYAILLPER